MTEIKATNFITETGRMVWGSLYKPRTVDYDGNPLVVKMGVDKGKATQRYEFGFALPKKATDAGHWGNSTLGAIVWAQGNRDHGEQAKRIDFAWKVQDGDSRIPNKKGGINAEKEGFPGHWVFTFSSTYPPQITNFNGSQYLLEQDAIKPGDFIQVAGSVRGNTGATPGVYLNHDVVAFQGHSPDGYISTRPDPSSLGLGGGPQPVGMTQTPPGGMSAPPVTPATPVVSVPAPIPTPVIAAPTPTPVTPHASILVPQITPAAPAVPVVPTVPPSGGLQRTAKWPDGVTYEQFTSGGWTDAMLRTEGFIL